MVLSLALLAVSLRVPVGAPPHVLTPQLLTPQLLTVALVANHLAILPFFNGPYNGGADRMSLLILICLCATYNAPTPAMRELALAIWGCNWCSPTSSRAG
jgi:hypothetical protein